MQSLQPHGGYGTIESTSSSAHVQAARQAMVYLDFDLKIDTHYF
jgi:hypothetical protein